MSICNTGKAQDAFLGVPGKSRGCRYFLPHWKVWPIPVGRSLILPAPHSSASSRYKWPWQPRWKSHHQEGFLCLCWALGQLTQGTPEPCCGVVWSAQPCGSLGGSALFPGKLMNLMDLVEFCASPGVCGHTCSPCALLWWQNKALHWWKAGIHSWPHESPSYVMVHVVSSPLPLFYLSAEQLQVPLIYKIDVGRQEDVM